MIIANYDHLNEIQEQESRKVTQFMQIKPYICKRCNRSYLHLPSLCRHKKFECGKNPQFKCPYCPYQAKQKGSMKSHIIRGKHWIKILELWELGSVKTFIEASDKCVDERPRLEGKFQCGCGRVYRHRASLFSHRKFECGKQPQFQCHLCRNKFFRKAQLQSHIIRIHKSL
ncbi:zinc finger X-chromosomal protein-like [Lycorma delicatula]|uniref:zinc finger X-chromosomal protein-like n=1 Tax=Lycorma delicatula TaxID=130591 RepID=UPI003F51812C